MISQTFVRFSNGRMRAFRYFAMRGMYSIEYRRAKQPHAPNEREPAYVADMISFASVTYLKVEVETKSEAQIALSAWRAKCEQAGFRDEMVLS